MVAWINVFIIVLLHSNKNEKKITITCNFKDESQKQHWLKVLEIGSNYYKITFLYNGKNSVTKLLHDIRNLDNDYLCWRIVTAWKYKEEQCCIDIL